MMDPVPDTEIIAGKTGMMLFAQWETFKLQKSKLWWQSASQDTKLQAITQTDAKDIEVCFVHHKLNWRELHYLHFIALCFL